MVSLPLKLPVGHGFRFESLCGVWSILINEWNKPIEK